MAKTPDVDYKDLYERMAKAVDAASGILIDAEGNCLEILEQQDEEALALRNKALENLDAWAKKVRFLSDLPAEAAYKQMYLILFNSINSALYRLEKGDLQRAGEILREGQRKAEELCVKP